MIFLLFIYSYLEKYGGVFKSRQLHQLPNHNPLIIQGFATTDTPQIHQKKTRNDTLMTRGTIAPDFKSVLTFSAFNGLMVYRVIAIGRKPA